MDFYFYLFSASSFLPGVYPSLFSVHGQKWPAFSQIVAFIRDIAGNMSAWALCLKTTVSALAFGDE